MRIFVISLIVLCFMGPLVFAEGNTYDEALSLYQKGDFKAAVQYLEKYVEKKPDPYAYYLIGYAHYKMKNHSEAMKYFKDAYMLDPNFSPPLIKKAKE